MAKEHKYHNSAVVIQTSFSLEQALNIAKEVVDSQREVTYLTSTLTASAS